MKRLGISWLILLAVACDGNPDMDAGAGDSGDMADAGFDANLPPSGDGNDSFADADPITLGEATMARIGTPGDQDFFTFDGTAGDWMIFATQTEMPAGAEWVDCVIQVFDSSMTMIAENDDGQPRADTDSEIIMQLPETGTYYVVVLEFSQWNGDAPEGMDSFVYELTAGLLDNSLAQVNVETEAGDDLASAIPAGQAGTEADFSLIAGNFEDGTDVDVYTLTVGTRLNASFYAMPVGPTGYGSTAAPQRMWVTNADGSEIIARIDDVSMLDSMSPPLSAAGEYQFWVEAPSGLGTNPFYVYKTFRTMGDNPPETPGEGNDLPATPEVLTQTPDPDIAGRRAAFILLDLPEADVDWLQVDVMTGEALTVVCGSRTSGSGIQDLRATVFDSTGVTEMATSTETATDVVLIDGMTVSPGTYLVRVDRGAQSADVTGQWVRCGIIAAPPAP